MIQQNYKAYQYACNLQPKLYKLGKPLFLSTPVTAFTYYQQQASGRCLILGSDVSWLEQSYSEHSWIKQPWVQGDINQASEDGYHCRLWQANDLCGPMTYVLNIYRCTHKNIKHMWSFGSCLDNVDLSLYFANQCESFKLFATRFMQICNQSIYPDQAYYACGYDHDVVFSEPSLLSNLIHKTPLKHFPIIYKGQEIWITHMEAICLQGISEGKTAKMIGRHVGLSYRTIEKHLENLKKKLKARSRDDLIYLFKQSRESWL
jgi:DNA-binding CsgD family transcriptional regulator